MRCSGLVVLASTMIFLAGCGAADVNDSAATITATGTATFGPPTDSPQLDSLCPSNSVMLTITNDTDAEMTLESATVNGESVATGTDVCSLKPSVSAGGQSLAGLGDISVDNAGGSGIDLVWSIPTSAGPGQVHTHIAAWTPGQPAPAVTTQLGGGARNTVMSDYQAMLQGADNLLDAFKDAEEQVWTEVSVANQ